MIVAGAIVPHAPLLTVRRDDESVGRIRDAVAGLVFEGAEAVVVLSPHGSAAGVYARAAGSLRPFGIPDSEIEAPADPGVVAELAAAWHKPVLDGPADHGIVVPLALLPRANVPIVAACLSEGDDRAERDAMAFVDALRAGDRSWAFVASTHTSSALSPRAPLSHRPEANDAEDGFVDALQQGAGLTGAVTGLEDAGGSCGLAPLAAFAHAFHGKRCDVVARERPFGVGYVVARAS